MRKICRQLLSTMNVLKTTYFSIFRSGFRKLLWQPYVELYRQAKNARVEQIWQTVKFNEPFSPAALASKVLSMRSWIALNEIHQAWWPELTEQTIWYSCGAFELLNVSSEICISCFTENPFACKVNQLIICRR